MVYGPSTTYPKPTCGDVSVKFANELGHWACGVDDSSRTHQQVKHGSTSKLMAGDQSADDAAAHAQRVLDQSTDAGASDMQRLSTPSSGPPPRFGSPGMGQAANSGWKEASESVTARGQQLVRAASKMKKFSPSIKGDAARYFTDFYALVDVAGTDFIAAMEYTGSDLPVAALYHASSVVEDTASSVYYEPLPVLRQRLLLSALRVSQEPAGEAMRLISIATQMGGVVLSTDAAPQMQAWQLLISRYSISTSVGAADYCTELFALQRAWPEEFSAATFQSFHAEVTAKAASAGIYPQDDGDQSAGLRSLWWKVLSEPIGASSQWVEVLRVTLTEVGHKHSTVRELQGFYEAMLRNIEYQTRMATNQPRVGSIRFASGGTMEMM